MSSSYINIVGWENITVDFTFCDVWWADSRHSTPEFLLASKVDDKNIFKILKSRNIDVEDFLKENWPEDYI